eukprot:6488565-Amphidinium_carterae.2
MPNLIELTAFSVFGHEGKVLVMSGLCNKNKWIGSGLLLVVTCDVSPTLPANGVVHDLQQSLGKPKTTQFWQSFGLISSNNKSIAKKRPVKTKSLTQLCKTTCPPQQMRTELPVLIVRIIAA